MTDSIDSQHPHKITVSNVLDKPVIKVDSYEEAIRYTIIHPNCHVNLDTVVGHSKGTI